MSDGARDGGDFRGGGGVDATGPAGMSTVELLAAGGRPPPEGCALRHAPVLLPMLLTGVSDENAANGVAALALVETVGEANDDALGVTTTTTTTGGGGDDDGGDDDAAVAAAAAAALPPPFRGAPGAPS